MNILKFSGKLKLAVDKGRNKQGVIADALAKLAGYKSHHQVKGNIKLVVEPELSAELTDETIALIKVMEDSFSNECIVFNNNLIDSSGDLLFDHYMRLATQPEKLLYELTLHNAVFSGMALQVDELDVDASMEEHKAIIAPTLPEGIKTALNIEIEEAERFHFPIHGYAEDLYNMLDAVRNHIYDTTIKIAAPDYKEPEPCIFEDLACASSLSIDDDSFRHFSLDAGKDDDGDLIALELHGESGYNYILTVDQLREAEKTDKTWFIHDPEDTDNPFILNCEIMQAF